jgi:hypothetical protein
VAHAREHGAELLAADAEHAVAPAHALAQALGHAAQRLVAGLMAVQVVDLLEVVDVDEDDAERLAGGQDALEHLVEDPVAEQAGERVVAGLLAAVLVSSALSRARAASPSMCSSSSRSSESVGGAPITSTRPTALPAATSGNSSHGPSAGPGEEGALLRTTRSPPWSTSTAAASAPASLTSMSATRAPTCSSSSVAVSSVVSWCMWRSWASCLRMR